MKNNIDIHGGKVIASGGYGCIFYPRLKCNDNKNDNDKTISKLMFKDDAHFEYKKIQEIKERLIDMKNINKYFILNNISICHNIEKISKRDLQFYTKNCRPLPKESITKKNINNHLNELVTIDIPYGGLRMDEYVRKNLSIPLLINVNEKLIDLLHNAIIPMNKNSVFHSDIKDGNVLIRKENEDINLRIIDWGLSYQCNNKLEIPKIWGNRPIQYNLPFSNLIISEKFIKKYEEFLQKEKNVNYNTLIPFVKNYLIDNFKTQGTGHYEYVNFFLFMIYEEYKERQKNIQDESTFTFIMTHIVIILKENYSKNKSAREMITSYMNNVFKHNIDIWGFLMCYIVYIELFYENRNHLSTMEVKGVKKLQSIIKTHLLEYPSKRINVNNLTKDLRNFNNILKSIPETRLSFLPDSIDLHKKRMNKKKHKSELKTKKKRREKMGKTMKRLSNNLKFNK